MASCTVPTHSRLTESDRNFPWVILLITIGAWLLPLVVYTVYSGFIGQPSAFVSIVILLLLVCSVPVVALLLYLVDKRREDGYVSIWGYK
jgi:Mn2+/Fe2+ NRAMP family transporter